MSEVKEINFETGEEIIRDFTDAENEIRNNRISLELEAQNKAETDAQAKADLLAKLNITEAEAKLLLS